MFIIVAIFNALDFLSQHPLYWQVPASLIATVGGFAWFKHKVAMEGRARIMTWITGIGSATTFLHMAIVGLPAASALHIVKLTAEQSVTYIGLMTLAYNFLKERVVKYLTSAEAEAPATSPATSPQKNQTGKSTVTAADAGVATF